MKRPLWLGVVALFSAILPGCGDIFRPIIIPNPPIFPNPAAAHTIVTVGDSGGVTDGSAMVIDVSGDSVASIRDVAIHPVHMVQQTATQVLALNQAITGLAPPPSGCLAQINGQVFNVCPSLTKLAFSGTVIGGTTTITLPPSSAANFVTVAPNDSTAYVSLPNFVPDPLNHPGVVVPSVGIVNITANNLFATIPVGSNPVALAVTPDKSKLYVANQGDGTLSAFNTIDRSPRTISPPPPLTAPPIWLSARSDSQRVYVLEGNGTLAWLDTSTTAGPDTFTETTISLPGALTMVYDSVLNRLYIPGNDAVGIVDVSQSAPQLLGGGAPVSIPTVSTSSRASDDPCATTTPGPLSVVAAAALPDGSRAYIGSFYVDNQSNVCPQVTVITTSNNTIKTSTAVPGFPDATNPGSPYYAPICATTRFRLTMAVAGDSTRAYLASCDGGNVSLINTSTDSYLLNTPAPPSARPPIPPSQQNPPQNPVFVIAGP